MRRHIPWLSTISCSCSGHWVTTKVRGGPSISPRWHYDLLSYHSYHRSSAVILPTHLVCSLPDLSACICPLQGGGQPTIPRHSDTVRGTDPPLYGIWCLVMDVLSHNPHLALRQLGNDVEILASVASLEYSRKMSALMSGIRLSCCTLAILA